MYMAPGELASRFGVIQENLRELRVAIANGLYKDAMRLVTQVNLSIGQLAADLARYSE
jgi:hypothetical protein